MKIKSFFIFLFLFIQLVSIRNLSAEVKLPKILTDNMVLQRNGPVKIWGWAGSGEKVSVVFNGQERNTRADRKGRWSVSLDPMKFGGPFEMRISGKKNSIVLGNILIGDVWIGSGQSNMSWKLADTNNAEEEITTANFPEIRLFTVERIMASSPQEDLSGGPWKVCTPENVEAFSAVAYYFGKNLQQELGVPVGLINTSWGGTNIEAWMRLDNLLQFEEYKKYKEIKPAKATQTEEEREQAWSRYQEALDKDKGLAGKWFEPSADISDWKTMNLPLEFGDSELGEANGIVWFSRDIEVPAAMAGKDAQLSLGIIDDKDITFVNGLKVGATELWNKKRLYGIPADLLKAGKNRITVKVTDNASLGGIRGEAPDLYLTGGGQKISLAGDWKYKPSALSTDYNIQNLSPNAYPSQLYNAMIAPLLNFQIKGAIWYQGESNAGNGYRYGSLFPAMITDWREKWGKDFPFIWVQLANYMMPAEQPGESEWADLREAQSKTLALPHTGQAVIIDIGEEGDIHPKNKKDVGQRLALAALKTAYNKDVVYSGPVFKSMTTEGNKAMLSFDNTGSGLQAKDKFGYLKEFAIAGEDRKFVWAKAYIEGDKVVVYSDQVKNPVAVRYAWADNPDQANLYNKEGLPASPFRTDTWETITQPK